MREQDQRPTIFVPAGSPIWVPDSVAARPMAGSVAIPAPATPVVPATPATPAAPAAGPTRPPGLSAPQVERTTLPRRRRPSWHFVPPTDEGEESGGLPDLTVPPEIFALAEEAAGAWAMSVTGWQVTATKPEKGWGAIWRIETNRGPRSLKLLHRPFTRNLFSIHAQEYLTGRGGRVAPLVRARSGELYTMVQGRMFIVTDWIQGLRPATKVEPQGAAALCGGLAQFHRLSRGYQPPPSAHFASRIHRWPAVYRKVRTKLDWFEHLARAYREMPASRLLLDALPRFKRQADEAIRLLDRSAYYALVERGGPAWGLVHQDRGVQRTAPPGRIRADTRRLRRGFRRSPVR